ncbi:MAG: sulfatase-like hydrolase/transferase, partial [Desulfobacterales bacterium]|nr:sulfatase-like hydrolase/transferase [Desulfobacterales bacterium]
MVRVLMSGVVALVLTVCGLCSNAVARDLPNVIYIMLDDLGPGEYDVYNNLQGLGQDSKIATPNINAMAANGMRFTNAHAATSLCAPTRAAVMAGAPTWQTRVRWGTGSASLQDGQQGVGDLMQAAGYNTAIMGKGHIGGSVPSNLDNPLGDGMKQHGYDYTLQLLRGIQAGPYVFWENDLATTVDADGNSTRITSANEATMTTYWPNGYDDGVTEIYSGSWGAVDFKTRDVPQAMLNKAV